MEWVRGSTDEFDLCRVAASFNYSLQPTVIPLRGLSAAELKR